MDEWNHYSDDYHCLKKILCLNYKGDRNYSCHSDFLNLKVFPALYMTYIYDKDRYRMHRIKCQIYHFSDFYNNWFSWFVQLQAMPLNSGNYSIRFPGDACIIAQNKFCSKNKTQLDCFLSRRLICLDPEMKIWGFIWFNYPCFTRFPLLYNDSIPVNFSLY